MIRLGDTVEFKNGFVMNRSGDICTSVMLLKWNDKYDLQYCVWGLNAANKTQAKLLKEGKLGECRRFIEKLQQDEEVITNA